MTLARARQIALALPEATEEPHFDLSSFRIRGKIFATAPPSGDTLRVFVDEPLRGILVASRPDAYARLHWGKKEVGLEVNLKRARVREVEEMLIAAWQRKAPRSLVKAFEDADARGRVG